MGDVKPSSMDQIDQQWQQAEKSRSPSDYAKVLKALEDIDAANPSVQTKWRLARACKDCAHSGDKSKMEALLMRGLQYADEALLTGEPDFKAPLWKGIMLGQCSDFVGIGDKVKSAPEIRDNFAKAIEMNPADAESKHCLGQWMFALADMNWVGRQASALLGLKGTFEEALELFMAAESAEPGFYLTNQFMIALCYKKLKQYGESMEWCEKVIAHKPITSPDEEKAVADAKELKVNVAKKM